jgi:hypothetical protein
LDDTGSITSFITEFSAFENHSVGSALRSLSKNDAFAARAEKLLDLDARLKLVKRMAFVRNLDASACAQIEHINVQAAQLAAKRDELIHTSRVAAELGKRDALQPLSDVPVGQSRIEREVLKNAWRPTLAEIDQCLNETKQIQGSLTAIIESVEDKDASSAVL